MGRGAFYQNAQISRAAGCLISLKKYRIRDVYCRQASRIRPDVQIISHPTENEGLSECPASYKVIVLYFFSAFRISSISGNNLSFSSHTS